ncbi:hypothetical protein KIN20_033347 [Parelaphostrongylus tenuis]|uniref:Uncharacterized protein n=1 Tax=Parelaphostrongylus tenuis TaxID=148309 RepID=A0AAD5R804_PARTN|nr:hypothetical protein KIN20_033347 [Parelaphostrongylus tenuis]
MNADVCGEQLLKLAAAMREKRPTQPSVAFLQDKLDLTLHSCLAIFWENWRGQRYHIHRDTASTPICSI